MTEWVLHRLYQKHLIRGEWFRLPEDIVKRFCSRSRMCEKKVMKVGSVILEAIVKTERRRLEEELEAYNVGGKEYADRNREWIVG